MTCEEIFLDPPGNPLDPAALAARKAQDLVDWLRSGDARYVHFVECRRATTPVAGDVVVFDVEVELPQRLTNDIRHRERVAVTFDQNDQDMPEIVALRADFPWVRHLNLRSDEFPRSLCLYEEKYADVRMDWTTVGFVERIRQWFALTAIDRLHAEDQPLESFLPDTGWSIVLPPDIASGEVADLLQPLPITSVRGDEHRRVLMTGRPGEAADPNELPHVATIVLGEPQPHGVISKLPGSLQEIHVFLSRAGIDLLGTLRERLGAWARQSDRQYFNAKLIIVAVLPLTRHPDGSTEATSTMCFLCDRTIRQIGGSLGLWDPGSSDLALFLTPDRSRVGEDVPIMVLNSHVALSRRGAARIAGLDSADERAITVIGVGALGAQVFDTLQRMGWGRWTLIDEDLLFPHNLGRHELNANAVGFPKALALAWSTTDTLCDAPVQGIVANVLNPRSDQVALHEALHAADVLLDMSTSIPVARFLASDVSSTARRASIFLNPRGTDSVLLVEDELRTAPLDWLEMQHYRALITNPGLDHHLRDPEGRVQYAHTCRDVSSVIPQELVALHAALAARGLRLALDRPDATIAIWRSGDDDVAVRRHRVEALPAIDHSTQGWVIRTDQWLLERAACARAARLPNETGGVLIGAYDLQRRIIYVVDLLPSPKDSTEWPTTYVRGCAGLAGAVEAIGDVTAQRLMYVGEWHSHPAGSDCAASGDDRRAFTWLKTHMAQDGLPPLMLIVCDGGHTWYVQDIL